MNNEFANFQEIQKQMDLAIYESTIRNMKKAIERLRKSKDKHIAYFSSLMAMEHALNTLELAYIEKSKE